MHDGNVCAGLERLPWDCVAGWGSSARRRSPCSPARCVLDRPFLRLCHPQRPLEAGRGAGHWARPPAAQSWLPHFWSFRRVPQRFPITCQIAIKFPHFEVNCCLVTFWSVTPFTPRPFLLPHPDKWLLGPTGFSGPCSPSLHQFLDSAVLGPDGTGLGPI